MAKHENGSNLYREDSEKFEPVAGYTSKDGIKRMLTAKERKELEKIREDFIESGRVFIEENNGRFRKFEEELTRQQASHYFSVDNSNPRDSLQIAFDNQEEYERFTEYAYDQFQGQGLGFVQEPIAQSICVQPRLWKDTKDFFPTAHPVSIEDIKDSALRIVSPYDWDPANVEAHFSE